jgi:hypothetical protein
MSALAPCGTKSARQRHKRNQETCEACSKPSRELAPCGTWASYRRGCRCESCTAANRDRQRAVSEAKGTRRVPAPCGTRSARRRHAAADETCETCAPGTKKPAPCGGHVARQRHKRRGETCTTCENAYKTNYRHTAPCGTPAAIRRHKKHGETCTTCGPITPRQPRKPLQPCGTDAAIKRHRYRNEPVCETCKQGDRERGETLRRNKGVPERVTIEDLITEIRFLINAGEGEHRILQATGYTGRNNALRTRLAAAGQHQLSAQIFGWDLAA